MRADGKNGKWRSFSMVGGGGVMCCEQADI